MVTPAVGYALLSAFPAGAATDWFDENATTFSENPGDKWQYRPGIATVSGGRILVSAGDSVLQSDRELVYTPTTSAGGNYIAAEHQLSFSYLGSAGDETGDDHIGVEVVDDGEGNPVFAVIGEVDSQWVWVATTVAAELNVDYIIRLELDFSTGAEQARYFYRKVGGSSFAEIAKVRLPAGSLPPNRVVHVGNGALTTMTATYADEDPDLYRRWSGCDGILTWNSSGGSAASVDAKSASASYREYRNSGSGWVEGSSYAGTTVFETFPMMALRFKSSSTVPRTVTGAFSPLFFGGLLVESGATGYQLQQTGSDVYATDLGDTNGLAACWFVFNEDFTIDRPSGALTFYGLSHVEIASGKTFYANVNSSKPTKLDPATNTKLKFHGAGKMQVALLDATGAVTLDYSDSTAATCPLVGNLKIDASTALALPAGLKEGDAFQLCTGTLDSTGAEGRHTITVGDQVFAAEVSFEGNQFKYQLRRYDEWKQSPAIFTWAGASATMASGAYRVFDCDERTDTDTTFYGEGSYSNVPGWEGAFVNCFWWVFVDNFATGSELPFFNRSGYVLRFAGNTGLATSLTTPKPDFELGGILVEMGAFGCGFSGDKGSSDVVRVGSIESTITNRIEIGENFALDGKALELLGKVELRVETGRELQVDGNGAVGFSRPNSGAETELKVTGNGVVSCRAVNVSGASTLDLSALSPSRSDPYFQSELELSDCVRFVLPESLGEGSAMKLCSGELVADNGYYAVALGAGEFFMAQITFDDQEKTLTYSTANCNRATLSGDCSWSGITWSTGKYDSALPVEITLEGDVSVTLDSADVSMPALLVLGPHRLTLLQRHAADFGRVFRNRSAAVTLALDAGCENFGQNMSVLAGVAYDVRLIGSEYISAPAEWSGKLEVQGRLTTEGYLQFAEGTCELDDGAEVNVASGRLSLLPNEDCEDVTFRLNGELSLGTSEWQPGAKTEIIFGEGGSLTTYDEQLAGVAVSEPLLLKAANGESVWRARTELVGPLAIYSAEGAKLTLQADCGESGVTELLCYGPGAIGLGRLATVAFSLENFVTGGLYGAKGTTVLFTEDPKDSGICDSLADASTWKGACWLRGIELLDFDPDSYGNAESILRLEGCNGNFARGVQAGVGEFNLVQSTDYPIALTLDYGYDGESVLIEHPTGTGTIKSLETTDGSRYRVFLPANAEFTGSLSVEGDNNRSAFVFGAGDSAERAACFNGYDGMIALLSGETKLNSGSSWQAVGGICVKSPAVLNDAGTIECQVSGDGTVKYTGSVSSTRLEEAAGYDQSVWTGTVLVEEATLDAVDFSKAGNSGSLLQFHNASGNLLTQTLVMPVELVGKGLEITSALNYSEVVFNRLIGSGNLNFDADIRDLDWKFRIRDIDSFEGHLGMDAPTGTVLLGDASGSLAAAIVMPDGFRMPTRRDWSATNVRFGSTLTVVGEVGDPLMEMTSSSAADFSYVTVSLENSPDPRRHYRLDYDADTKQILVLASPSPPEGRLASTEVRYGVDYTNASVVVNINGYWSGYDYEGRTIAEVMVYDAQGAAVGYGSSIITNDGETVIGFVDLPSGQGTDYRYDVKLLIDGSTESGTVLDSMSVDRSGVRRESGWFDEDVDSFKSTVAAEKTGSWIYATGCATVSNEFININASDADGKVCFKPYVGSSNELVKVETSVIFYDAFAEGIVPDAANPSNRVAALSLIEIGKASGVYAYAGWVPDADSSAGGSFVPLYGNAVPVLGQEVLVGWTVNYRTGMIAYSVDGSTLTNEFGESHFQLVDLEGEPAKTVNYNGQGSVRDLTGEQYNALVAEVVVGTETNRFESLDEAVAAAVAAKVNQVTLLWDSCWHPTVEDFKRTIRFVSPGGYKMSVNVDSAAELTRLGYQVVDLGDGKYKIDVIKYEIAFDANEGEGTMEPKAYTATNLVFKLPFNEFTRTGYDFAGWNTATNGVGEQTWADGAEIDMSTIGLTNLTLYAQWKRSVRMVTVEAADEYVYIESVTTNGVEHAGVRYFSTGAQLATATGTALIPVLNDSSLTIRYSTDLERKLTFDCLKFAGITSKQTIPNATQPKIDTSAETLTPLQYWAAVHGISPAALASSSYAAASCAIGASSLITDESEIVITEFKTTATGCSFKITVDGNPISEPTDIAPLVQTSTNLAAGWTALTTDSVSVDADGTVNVVTDGDSTFVKIVIPKSN